MKQVPLFEKKNTAPPHTVCALDAFVSCGLVAAEHGQCVLHGPPGHQGVQFPLH
jgi:hypothetical protein